LQALGDERGIASALKNLGYLTAGSDDVRAARLVEEALTRVVAVGDAPGIRGVMRALTVLPLPVDAARITALLTEGIATFRARGDRKSLAVGLNLLAEWLRDHGEYARAQALAEESLALDHALGDAGHAVVVYHTLSLTALLQGEDARAQALAEACVALARRMEGKWYLPWPLITLGYIAQHQAAYAQAWAFLQESLALVRAFGHQGGIALCLAALGGVVGSAGAPDKAAQLFSAAERIMETLHERWSPVQQREFERNLAIARAQVDAVSWAAAWAAGRAMTLEQAIAYALEDDTTAD
jgi:tetratricopeptide (TPR) repeat protein